MDMYYIYKNSDGEYAGSGVTPIRNATHNYTQVAPVQVEDSIVYWDGSEWRDTPSGPHTTPNPSEYIPTSTALISQLWEAFNAHAKAETDLNSRASISLILANPDSTAQQRQRATEWGQWWAALWQLYGQKRAEIVATGEPVTYELQSAPWTIWEIAE